MPFKPGKPVHPVGGTGTAPNATLTPAGIQISFDSGSNRNRQTTGQVIVTNREVAQNLEISFANGKDGTFFAIAPNTTVPFDVAVHSCRLRGAAGGTADFSIMGIVI